jgi:hypothetical protein
MKYRDPLKQILTRTRSHWDPATYSAHRPPSLFEGVLVEPWSFLSAMLFRARSSISELPMLAD